MPERGESLSRPLRWLPALAIAVGLATRSGAGATWLIGPCLALIMFGAFLETRALEGWRPTRFLWTLLGAQLVIGAAGWLALRTLWPVAAGALLLIALTPTAVSAAAAASAARADARLVTSTIAVSNLFACLTLPLAVAFVGSGELALGAPLRLVGLTVVLPFVVALVIGRGVGGAAGWPQRLPWRVATRVLWATILWASASQVDAWRAGLLLAAAAFVLLLVVSLAAGPERRVEGAICFAHKNTGLALLLAIETLPAFVTATVVAYSLAQNLFFSLWAPARRRGDR